QTQGKPVCNTAFDIWTSKAPSAKGVGFTHSPSFNAETALFGTYSVAAERRQNPTIPQPIQEKWRSERLLQRPLAANGQITQGPDMSG
ncbi:hypothetical protein, partial [Ensifer sp. ENS02]|uniref:hypothetical protein n=1 Tax=Ensifer sp. ENS02 TaxID=2769290 RepID=UPI001AEE7235